MDSTQLEKIRTGQGFFAALDQSGGSTPKALAEYGVDKSRYSTDDQMYDLVHRMRSRILTSPAFGGDRILGAILFKQTMDRDVDGVPTAQYLWDQKQVVPFLKVDSGLADQEHGVQLMKPIDGLDELLTAGKAHRIFGTKMRSVIQEADHQGVMDIVEQQFEYGSKIFAAGLVPILEPEVSISSTSKEAAETLLRDALHRLLDTLPEDFLVMLKLTIPTAPDLYAELAAHPRVLRILALSGGYDRSTACRLLARDSTMIASFSRALLEGLSDEQTPAAFDAQLSSSIADIYDASVGKR